MKIVEMVVDIFFTRQKMFIIYMKSKDTPNELW